MISIFVCLVCFGLYINVLSVSIRFSAIFCIYEHIKKICLGLLDSFFNNHISKTWFVCTKMVLNGFPRPPKIIKKKEKRRQQKSPAKGQKY